MNPHQPEPTSTKALLGAEPSRPPKSARYSSGFTLIELMVVLAIIGLLSTFAISQYRNYLIRTRVVEGLNLAAPAKLAVAEAAQSRTPEAASTMTVDIGAITPTPNVAAITAAPGGVLTITYTNQIGNTGTNAPTLTLTPYFGANSVSWQCAAAGVTSVVPAGASNNPGFVAGTLGRDFAPENCRQPAVAASTTNTTTTTTAAAGSSSGS